MAWTFFIASWQGHNSQTSTFVCLPQGCSPPSIASFGPVRWPGTSCYSHGWYDLSVEGDIKFNTIYNLIPWWWFAVPNFGAISWNLAKQASMQILFPVKTRLQDLCTPPISYLFHSCLQCTRSSASSVHISHFFTQPIISKVFPFFVSQKYSCTLSPQILYVCVVIV